MPRAASVDDPFANLLDTPPPIPAAGTGEDIVVSARAAVARAQAIRARLQHMGALVSTPEARGVGVVDATLRQFGATAALAVRVADDDDGATLELVGATGGWGELVAGPAEADAAATGGAREAPVPLTTDGPLVRAVQTGVPSYCDSRTALAERWPGLADTLARHGVEAVAAVPVWYMGRVEGGLALLFDAPRRFTLDERTRLRAMSVRYARALAHARLYYAEHAARAAAVAAREDAERAREAAERANQVKDDFLAVVSHELRTPLQAVIGFSELLEAEMAGPLTERQREFVQRIQAGGSHLLHIIEDLLGFSRAQAGKELVHPEPFDPSDTVAQVVAMAAPLAERKRVRLRFEGPAGGVRFRSDPFKVRQIATNLVGNAVKFTGWGEVAVALEAWDAAGAPATLGVEAARVRLTVRDTGVGIPADQHERVFDPFVQVAAPTTRVAGGTGLGLSIVRQLARLLGGDVRLADSEVGRGSTFVVELPAVAEAPSAAAPHGASPNGTPPAAAGAGEHGAQPERASRDLATT